MQHGPPLQRGLLVRHGGGCLTPRVLDFLCFDTPRSVLGEEGEEELPFFLVDEASLQDAVDQDLLPCPALWVERSALAAGSGTLKLVYCLGGTLHHYELPSKPLKLQPVKQQDNGSARGKKLGGAALRPSGDGYSSSSSSGAAASHVCRAYVSARRHMQLYRLQLSLFPKLSQLDADLRSGAVVLWGPQSASAAAGWVAPGLADDTATPVPQGVLLERLDEHGEPCQLTIMLDLEHACLVLREAPGPGCTPPCLRSVNSLAEALAVLHKATGRLGPSLTASPLKPASTGRPSAATILQSPAKPPLPAAHGTEALRLAVALIQECGSAQLREGLAILSAAAANPHLCLVALGLGAMEALVTAAATVLPTTCMGMAELQPSLLVAVTSLLDAAPASAFAAGRLVSIFGAVLQQSCANPLLLCRLLATLVQRVDVRAEAMRQGLAGTIACMFTRLCSAAAAATGAAGADAAGAVDEADAVAGEAMSHLQQVQQQGAEQPERRQQQLSMHLIQQQQQQQQQSGFGSPVQAIAGGSQGQGQGQDWSSRRSRPRLVAELVATYNAMSDSGSDCSPSVSCSSSPAKGSPMRSPSALSSGRFSVPRLALPTCESPTAAAAGLTRSTRRVLSSTPGGARSPSPYGSPTRRSGTCGGDGEPAAAAELTTLATALGESLMAADLPAIVAHKRQADARLDDWKVDGVPAELLEAPAPPSAAAAPASAAKKVLEAHRILVTARSLCSIDTSVTHTSGHCSEAGALAELRLAGLPVDVDQVKCLLLQSLVAALPLIDPTGWPSTDPAPVLAAEVLSLLGRPLSPAQDQLKGLAVQALLRLSQRPIAVTAPPPLPSSGGTAGASGGGHVLVAAAGRRLDALAGDGRLDGEARSELLALLQLLTDYTAAVQQSSVAGAVVQHCLRGLQSLMGVLQASGLDPASWQPPAWQLLQFLVQLLAAVCRRCEAGKAEAGRGMLSLLLADQQVAAMLAGAASHMLLVPDQMLLGSSFVQRSRAAGLQRDLLQLFAALAALAGRQPPCVQQPHNARDSGRGGAASRHSLASSGGVDGQATSRAAQPGPAQDLLLGMSARRGLTRRQALLFFGFLVSPHSGLAQRVLDHDPTAAAATAAGGGTAAGGAAGRGLARGVQQQAPAQQQGQQQQQAPQQGSAPGLSAPSMPASNVRLRQGVLDLIKATFAAPGSPFAADKFVSDFYIRFHFVQFLKLYHNPQRDHQALFLCRQHMDVLLVLAASKSPHIRHRFHQLSVVDFFTRELSLEFEAKQPARGRMHRLSSSGSQPLEQRRTSSCSSMVGGLDSGTASPVPSLRLPMVPQPQQQQQQGLPPGVPMLRLPSQAASGPAVDSSGGAGSGSSSPVLRLPPGISSGGSRASGVPRLNLGGSGSGPIPALHSPGGESTPSPGNSARHGRPPLPPSARSGVGATPRLTSRLGRMPSARSCDISAAAAAAAAAAAIAAATTAPPSSQHAGSAMRSSSSAGGKAPFGKLAVPKLGLMGIGRSNAAAASPPAATETAPSAAPQVALHAARPHSRVHFSTPPPEDVDSDSGSSSDEGMEGTGNSPAAAAPPFAPAPSWSAGFDVPSGFTFTGDLEDDLDRLEALEAQQSDAGSDSDGLDSEGEGCGHRVGSGSESASPTIPALRSSPFQSRLSPVPPLLAGSLHKGAFSHLEASQPAAFGGGGGTPPFGGAVPRLDLGGSSLHSNLEGRNASAQMQLAAVESEQRGKSKQARGALGALERSTLAKGKVQAASVRKLHGSFSDMAGLSAGDVSYTEERGRRLLYRDEGLHLEVLQLVFTLVFNDAGQLDATYCDQFPWERKLQNIPFILYHHLNHDDNRPLLPHLLPRLAGSSLSGGSFADSTADASTSGSGGASPALRLLRVLCAAFFRPEWYTGRSRISSAAGAYSTVYRASLPAWAGDGTVVLKLVDTPRHIQDRCAQVDMQGEVSVLQALAGSSRACQLLDYGVDPAAEAMFLVLKDYRCSLKQWRARQPDSPASQLRLYYALFAEVAAATASLLDRGIVHFDLKCDNCLLEPLPGVSESEFWSPSSERLPFRVVLADFGESKAFSKGVDAAITARARGTDCFKSPEMLLVGGTSHHKEQRFYDRRRRQGAGPASDIWSLGCLLFELVTGKLLFSDSDWLLLLARVTSTSMPLITEDRAALVAGLPGMLDLLQYILVRDARMRPTLADVQARLAAIRSSSRVRLPPHVRSFAPPMSSRGSHGGLSRSEGSQLFSPTAYCASAEAAMPMPLLAALPLSSQLVLAPVALLSSPAALQQHPTCRVVLLFSAAGSACGSSLRGGGGVGAGISPASSPGSRSSCSSRSGSPPPPPARRASLGQYSPGPLLQQQQLQQPQQLTRTYTLSANPVFSPSNSSMVDSTSAGGRTPARALTGLPRTALLFGSTAAAVHPESDNVAAAAAMAAEPVSAASSPGCSPTRPLLGPRSTSRVHPELSHVQQSHVQQSWQPPPPRGLQLILPQPADAAAAAAGGGARDAALLTHVLADRELAAAAATCAAGGVECHLALTCPSGRESRMQQPLALAEWLTAVALSLLNSGAGRDGGRRQQQLPVVLAVQAGCEAEAAMAAVAHLMQHRQVSLYQAMVAASQWGIDLHLRSHHLMALQHWAATDGPAASSDQLAGSSAADGREATAPASRQWR